MEGGYYPLIRRTQIGPDGTVKAPIDPQFYGLNLVDQDADLSQLTYSVVRFERT